MVYSIKVTLLSDIFLYVWGGMHAIVMGSEMCHMHRARVRGRKFFHSKCIS